MDHTWYMLGVVAGGEVETLGEVVLRVVLPTIPLDDDRLGCTLLT